MEQKHVPTVTSGSSHKVEKMSTLSQIEQGLKVIVVEFHKTVRVYGADKAGQHEAALYDDPTVKSAKRAKMVYTPYGLICIQTHGSIVVPLANVAFAKFE